MADIVGMVVGAGLTLLIFGYLLGDLPWLGSLFRFTYRLALHIFIGALIGYTAVIIFREVWIRMVLAELRTNLALVIPVMIGLGLFLFKSIHRLSYIGNIFLAPLLGVGVAVALSGALLGTLVPQVSATAGAMHMGPLAGAWELLKGVVIVVGTVCTLMVFNFIPATQKQSGLANTWNQVVRAMAWVGRWFLLVTLGVAFAGALTASLSIFIGRIQYLIDVLESFLLIGG